MMYEKPPEQMTKGILSYIPNAMRIPNIKQYLIQCSMRQQDETNLGTKCPTILFTGNGLR
jgi:hypothetical protein